MPGGNLTNLERSLLARWDQPQSYQAPLLRSIEVSGTSGIRGIKDATLRLKYPVTTIVGRNATGKSTWLALAALAFHSPPGHTPINALRNPKRGESGSYYTFSDFFYRGPHDAAFVGAKVTWEYSGPRPPLTIHRKSEKRWMTYERRPKRAVHFFGIARTVPAIERRVLRSHFQAAGRSVSSHLLDDEHIGYLMRITGIVYQRAEVFESGRYQLRGVQTDHAYSSFNMGAGEDLLIEVLYLLQSTSKESLVVIEEIELGLHPRAVVELAGVLLEVADKRGLQIIVSSHSRDFIDSMPRQSRVLIEREGDEHRIHYGPTTRFALSGLRGEAMPELTVYCEDDFARRLIELSLPADALRRVRVLPIGASSELARCANYHVLAGVSGRSLVVWDGDVTNDLIDSWIRKHAPTGKINWVRLPGGQPPERWVVQTLRGSAKAVEIVAQLFNTRPEHASEALATIERQTDPHSLGFHASQELGLDAATAEMMLLAAARQVPAADLGYVVSSIEAVLAGHHVVGGAVVEPELTPPVR